MLCRFPCYDDPPAPQEPPEIHTSLSPPKPRLNRPSSSQTTPTDSHPHPQTSQTRTRWPTSSPHETGTKRTRVSSSSSSSSHPGGSDASCDLLNSAKANLSPPTTMPSPGPSSLSLTRRGTVLDRRDSLDADSRSMISCLLDAYCQSDASDDAWDDDASEVCSDETASLDYLTSPSSLCTFRCRRGSNSTITASELPTKRSNPLPLLVGAPPPLASVNSAALVTKNLRPLPPVPPSHLSPRPNVRPLPRPPSQPPPYTPLIDDNSASDIPPIPSLSSSHNSSPSASSTSFSGSTSFVSIPSASNSMVSILSSTDQPMVSKYHRLPPLPTIPASPSSQEPSPLLPDIPVPPSPMTARRHQAMKLTQMLGEEISLDLLGPNRPINRVPTHQVANDLSLTPPTRRIQSRAVRPHALYMHDGTPQKLDVLKEDSETCSLSDFTDHEEIVHKGGIKIDLSVEESDDTGSSEASEILSPSDSILEEMDDMEEARIGWALQNVITYQKAARVKRISRMWVLEKDGQRWEEEDHTNIRQVLRQL